MSNIFYPRKLFLPTKTCKATIKTKLTQNNCCTAKFLFSKNVLRISVQICTSYNILKITQESYKILTPLLLKNCMYT